jgi:hypothetical protein
MKGHKSEHHRKRGGEVAEDKLEKTEEGEGKEESYSGKNNVEKEAKEKKHGGKVKRKHGGRAEHHVEGKKAHMHLGRPGRKAGGRVGADKSPLSSAHNITMVKDHHTDD